ncbi:MAG: MFS transporter [Clostridia bacterium]|nr:MFS transporter [Clostridia bacterium]
MAKQRQKAVRRTDLSGRVRFFDMISLGIGDLGYSIISCTVATYIVTFGTMALPGVGGNAAFDFSVLMAIAVGIAVLFDAVSDPIMGYISDHFNSKVFGKRHLFMLIGLIGMMATALAVWYIPYQNMSVGGTFAWFTVFLILIRTFNTMYYTPMGAFSTEISTDYNERTKIQTVRSILYVIGMLLPVLLMASFQNKYAGVYELGALSKDFVNPFTLKPLEHYKDIDAYISDNRDTLMAFINGIGGDKSKYLVQYNGKDIITPFAVKEYLAQFGQEFRSGNMIAAGYQVFAIVATAICIVTSAFFLLQSRIHVPLVRKREEQEAAEKGIDLNAPAPKFTMAQCRQELIAQGVENPTNRQTRALLRKKREDAGQVTVGAIFRNFFAAFKVKEMAIIAIGYVTAMMSATLIISLGFNVFTFTFRLTATQMYVLMGALLACTIGFQPVWAALAKKKSKHFSMFTGLIISFVGCCLLFLMFLLREQINTLLLSDLSWLGVVIMAPSLMIAGAGTGVLYSMPLALVGDVVVLQKEKTGEDKTGTYSGVMTFCYKIGQGIMTTVSTMLLAAVGFVSGQSWQSEGASEGIGWILCVGVVIFVGAGIVIFSRLKLDRKKITEILEKNNKKDSSGIEETSDEQAVAADDQEK